MKRIAGCLLLLAACGGGSEVASTTTTERETTTTTTTTVADCPPISLPRVVDVTDECRVGYLLSAGVDLGLTADADTQAQALCREMGISGVLEGFTFATIGWDEGSRPSPADDQTGFVALTLALYCPEFFDEFKALGS